MSLSLQKRGGEVTNILKERLQREGKSLHGVLLKNIGKCLPEHLIMEILSWLPVRSLLQFKVVSHLWYDMIKSPHFISMHLKNYLNNNDDCRDCFIARCMVTQAEELCHKKILIDGDASQGFSILGLEETETPMYNAYLCGPCDGIYYMCGMYSLCNERGLWNPALNEFKLLPCLIKKPNLAPRLAFSCYREYYGFGYDRFTKDYKVIIMKGYTDTRRKVSDYNDYYYKVTDYPLSVFIYSLRNDSWRYWGDLRKSYFLNCNTCYVFVNDSFYWLGTREAYGDQNFEVIISFNLATDTCQELKLPDYEKPAKDSLAIHDEESLVSVKDFGKTLTELE
ncbi:F-box protein CPR1-like [Spinacia oleracea]|uniref:F-box protein CPR1-like n=1 Tax=Spinacia oleracea TaxID=3562 RepID=A0A9R0I8F0_SPIOL|nr:F-box protein CPR1-like [Spinacia oleracea]